MFRDKRDFRAIIFNSPKIATSEQILGFFPKDLIQDIETIHKSDDILNISHAHYLTSSAFTSPDILKDIEVVVNGNTMYQYSMYTASFKINDRNVHLIAVPFSKMAAEVFNNFSISTRGNAIKYQKVDIINLINACRIGKNLEGDIKITRIELEIEGDSPTKSITMAGTNVPISKTFTSVTESLSELQFRYRRCRLLFDDKSNPKFSIEIDRFGNYLIPVRAKAKNLPWIVNILKFFFNESLIREDSLLPPIGKVKDESEMTDEL